MNVTEVILQNWPKEFPKGDDVNLTLAKQQHQEIVTRLMTGPGDGDGAMYRAERMFGLPYWCQFNLRHKGRATLSFMQRVHAAYVATIERSVKRDLATLKLEQAKDDADTDLAMLVAQAENLLAEIADRKAKKGGLK